jgi:peptidyl-prolyl cis-trans isomerase SurA
MMNMKSLILLGVVLCLSLPVLAADAANIPKTTGPEIEVIDEIVAKVNGAIITRSELTRARNDLVKELERRKVPPEDIDELVKQRGPEFLRDRIDHLLLVQRGEQIDMDVDQEVSKYFANLMLQFKVVDQDKFAQLVYENTGLRFEDYKDEVKNGILTQRVLQSEVGSRVVIPREDIVNYYEEHKEEYRREERVFLSEILVSSDDTDVEDEILAKKADALVERARRGERFEELARDNSDAVTADSGGDLGGWKKGDLRKDIEEMIWDKDKNYVTDPIKQENGYLILKVRQHHQAGVAYLEEVENEITGILHEPLFQPMVREYLTELRQQAYLEIKEGYVDSEAAPGKDTAWKDPAMLVPETVTKEEVIAKPGRKKLLFIPIPGTKASPKSSSK